MVLMWYVINGTSVVQDAAGLPHPKANSKGKWGNMRNPIIEDRATHAGFNVF